MNEIEYKIVIKHIQKLLQIEFLKLNDYKNIVIHYCALIFNISII